MRQKKERKLGAGHPRVIQELKRILPEIRRQYRVASLSVFGSYVRGEAGRKSDLDLLVEFDRAPSLFEFARLQRYMTQALGVSVDLVMKKALRPRIGSRILEEAVPLL